MWRRRLLAPGCLLALAGAASRADLPRWLQHVPAVARLEAALFRRAPMPSGEVLVRRPPREARVALGDVIAADANDALAYALRARAAEEDLDFAAAEADWKKHSEIAPDRFEGLMALADFYHRRLEPQQELTALGAAAQQPASPAERFKPVSEQRSWRAFERAVALVQAQALPAATGAAQYRAWIARNPKERTVYERFFAFAAEQKDYPAAEEAIAAYGREFPGRTAFPVSARARLEQARGSAERALAVYEKGFRPVWAPALVKEYFALLASTHNLRRFIQSARAAQAANPGDLSAAARVFYYYQQQGNLPAANRALVEFRRRKTTWKPGELADVARLFEGVKNYDEAARAWYALYRLPGAPPGAVENALGSIVAILFSAPEQPLPLGAGDLSFYKDIGSMDANPGFLNGILSLLLNSTNPPRQFQDEDHAARAYFHRVRAAELLALFEAKHPKALERRAALRTQLVRAYATYGDNDGVIRASREFLGAFPRAAQRTDVTLLMAEAYARKGQTQEEFATYDALLKELAARADGVPLGERGGFAPLPPRPEGGDTADQGVQAVIVADQAAGRPGFPRRRAGRQARSPEYASVLDRYIARLVAFKRPLDALALLRRELDRNPNDPGLYDRVAAFLEQNRIDNDVEQVYRRAIQQFQGASWYDKLARWYIRRRQAAAFEHLTRELIGIFSGAEVEAYFRGVVPGSGGLGPVLYRQVNLYAHQRFPYDLTFVRNLLAAYRTRGTENPAAWEALMRTYWFYDGQLRAEYFAYLSGTGALGPVLQGIRIPKPADAVKANPAIVQFAAEGEAWRSHFEAAAPALEALAGEYPASIETAARAASLARSLARTAEAAGIEQKLQSFEPRDHTTLTRLGEIYADREQYDLARPFWNRIPEIEPGRPETYVEAATIFWDYFLYDDALRILNDGRKRLGHPNLYAYEAGAIYENKRDYARAVAEYMKDAGENSRARRRLLALGRRPARRDLVDKLTAERAGAPDPDPPAVSLRIALLESQNRRADLEAFLTALVARTTSPEMLDTILTVASRDNLDALQERTYERQIAVTADPVERMTERLALMRFYEGRHEADKARATVEAVYKDNPAILGVVRATADFYWRNKLPGETVTVLARAASIANVSLKIPFTMEAAAKATESGDSARARALIEPLLKAEPKNPAYIAAMADTWVRQGDDRALRAFYEAKIGELRGDTANTAALRRGLIPVLTRQKDYAGGIDQYIEILKSFPEDEGLARESANYASAHNQRKRLQAFFEKAVADSPKDYRWPVVLARIETSFEDLPSAEAAYARAVAIRPDRVDLHTARAALQERLMRFDDALTAYRKIYELAYHDPRWMVKAAELNVRQGRRDAAVQALRDAFLTGRPDRPQAYFDAARLLDSWDLLPEARKFAERGAELAGAGLMSDAETASARLYARILTRSRAYETAFERLKQPQPPPVEKSWAFQNAATDMGAAVKAYFTPEEKAAFEAFLLQQAPAFDLNVLVPAARAAGLADLEARWIAQLMMANPGPMFSHEQALLDLQQRRGRFGELAKQLEAYWQVYPNEPGKERLLDLAAQNYRRAGDPENELRVLEKRAGIAAFGGPLLDRYFELLLTRRPRALAALAGERRSDLSAAAVNFAVASGKADLALAAVGARGAMFPPVWARAYTGLVGVYYREGSPAVDEAFRGALASGTIGEALGRRIDRTQSLAGSGWFYYGGEYGAYLDATKKGGSEDWLPAIVEGTPGRPQAYFTLAEYYRETGGGARALAEYAHALELDPKRADAHARMAAVLWDQGKKSDATAHWRDALDVFARILQGRPPATFWPEFSDTLEALGKRNLVPALRPEADRVLRAWIRRSGSYRTDAVATAVLAASPDAKAAAEWLANLSRAAEDPAQFLNGLVRRVPEPAREPIYEAMIDAARAKASQLGESAVWARGEVLRYRLGLVRHFVEVKEPERARTNLDLLPEEARQSMSGEVVPLEILIAAQEKTLDALLERYRRERQPPPLDGLRNAAAALREKGDAESARRVLEFVYTSALDGGDLSATNFLGLAEVRLEQGDVATALGILRRMALVSGEPFENLVPAADLLDRTGHKAEARPFLEQRVRAVPWDMAARVKLGDASVAKSPEAPYELRARAALLAPAKELGSAELDLLAAGKIDPASAEKPYFYFARVRAAESAPAADRVRLLSAALAIDPASSGARLGLFRAALDASKDEFALAVMAPLIGGSVRYRIENAREALNPEEVFWLVREFLQGGGYTEAERAGVARGLAEASARTRRPAAAIFFYQVAQELQPTTELQRAIDGLRAREAIARRDAARRPSVKDGLEQEHVVLPRLEGGAE